MDDAWRVLLSAGVPDGAIRVSRRADAPSDARLAAALDQVVGGITSPREAEPLAAWLAAFHHHWPSRFERTFGTRGIDALAQLRRLPLDPARYLKLRRIAIDNLARRANAAPLPT